MRYSFFKRLNDIKKYSSGYVCRKLQSINYLENCVFAWHLQHLFKKLDIQCVLDIGANIGGFKEFLRQKVGFKGSIISFEPVRQNYERLRLIKKKDYKWEVYPYALGSEPGEKDINVMKDSLFSSFLTPDDSNTSDFRALNQIHYKETVEMKTLDSILTDLKINIPKNNLYLKIDTQGYEMEVLKGAARSLASFYGIQVELPIIKLYKEPQEWQDILKYVLEAGFDIAGFFPVNYDSRLRLIEVDCVMINKNYMKLAARGRL